MLMFQKKRYLCIAKFNYGIERRCDETIYTNFYCCLVHIEYGAGTD